MFHFYDIRQTGVAPDNLKYEEDTFHKIEMDLVRELRRVFRKGKGFSFQHIGQILSPRSAGLSGPNKKPASPSSTLPRNRLVSKFSCLFIQVICLLLLCLYCNGG